ncbi:MAG TPA: single-stranded DNA-binding protein [Saprospiraceae bacterium]|nr:single-stranded DNA-binding protein [Saprospiraceae bacterium]
MNTLRNHVQLIGNLGNDVEFTQFDSGSKMARLTLATNEFYKNNKGEQVKETQWHTIVAWGKLAETMEKILSKGVEVAVNGKLRYRTFEGKDGKKRTVSEIVAQDFLKISKKDLPF